MSGAPRRLRRADGSAVVDALAEAFASDPLVVRLAGGEPAATRALVAAIVGMNRWGGGLRWGVDAGGHLAATALVSRPRAGWASVRADLAMVRFLPAVRALTPASVRLFNSYGAAVRRAAPAAPHHYLAMVGARPDHRGQGLASALLAAVIEAADADPRSAGVALDTENAANVALYQRKGFLLTDELLVDDLPVHCMFRPRKSGHRGRLLP